MTNPQDLKPGAWVRLTNPRTNTDQDALARHGDIWEITKGCQGSTSDGEVLVASLTRTYRLADALIWWRLADMDVMED